MRAIANPKFLPQTQLLDDLFGLVVLSLQRYREISRATPKAPPLTVRHVEQLWGEVGAFYNAYFQTPQDRAAMLAHADLIGGYATQILRWVDASAAPPLLKQYVTETLEDALTGVDRALHRPGTPKATGPEGVAAARAQLKLTALDVLCVDSSASIFSDSMNELLDTVEADDPASIGWERVPNGTATYAEQLTSDYTMSEDQAQARYGLPTRLVLRVSPMERSNVRQGYCMWYEGLREVTIGIMALPEHPMVRAPHVSEGWALSLLLHECVHLMQAVEQFARGEPYTGLGARAGTRYSQFDKRGEAQLKREFAATGRDPRYVNFHTLDDIEFYTLLLEEVLVFLQLVQGAPNYFDAARQCFTDLSGAVAAFTQGRPFFEILREMQPDKYRLALIELETTAELQRDELERMYLCRFRDPYQVASVRRRRR